MSLKTKRHTKNRNQIENNQVTMDQERLSGSRMSAITDQARTTLNSVRNTASNNKILLGTLAAGAGVVAYVVASERGRNMTNSIKSAITDSFEELQQQTSTGWERVVSGGTQLINRVRGTEGSESINERAA